MLKPTLLILALLFAVPPSATGGEKAKPPKYPLSVQVRQAEYGCSSTNCEIYDMRFGSRVVDFQYHDSDKYYFGRGMAFLHYGNTTKTIWFAYHKCLDPLPISNTDSLAARWEKSGQGLELLVPQYSPNKPVEYAAKYPSKCQLDISYEGPVKNPRPSSEILRQIAR